MSKVFRLIDDLTLCYQIRAPFAEDYYKLSSKDRHNLCLDIRKALIDYVNSPEYCFLEITQTLYKEFSKDQLYPYNLKRDLELGTKGLPDFGKM